MHALAVIKNACLAALDDEEPDIGQFRAIVDPGSVLDMAYIIETLLKHVEGTGTGPELVQEVKRACWIEINLSEGANCE